MYHRYAIVLLVTQKEILGYFFFSNFLIIKCTKGGGFAQNLTFLASCPESLRVFFRFPATGAGNRLGFYGDNLVRRYGQLFALLFWPPRLRSQLGTRSCESQWLRVALDLIVSISVGNLCEICCSGFGWICHSVTSYSIMLNGWCEDRLCNHFSI